MGINRQSRDVSEIRRGILEHQGQIPPTSNGRHTLPPPIIAESVRVEHSKFVSGGCVSIINEQFNHPDAISVWYEAAVDMIGYELYIKCFSLDYIGFVR